MDRKIVYTGEIPLGDDFLLSQKFTMTALAMALKAILGTSTIVDGLACTPTGPASMQVLVGPGSIYSLVNLDGTAYGDIASDTTHQIVKQGISLDNVALNCPAPVTTGNSINYLIQVAYQDQDTDSTVLPYFDASNPAVAYAGPADTGVSQNTTRKGACVISVKAGASATTGTQVTPAPDAGFMGLWYVTVPNGASSITSGNIHLYAGAAAATGSTAFWSTPFIAEKLNDKVSIATGDLRWEPLGGGGGAARGRLSNATTYHVSTTGNDTTGDGSSGTPWATIQKAINFLVTSVDLNGFTATIQLADGTYTGGASSQIPFTGGGPSSVIINGNSGTPSNVIISTSGDCFAAAYSGSGYTVQNLKMQSSAGNGISTANNASILMGTGLIFGACNQFQITSDSTSSILIQNNYTVTGGGRGHLFANRNSSINAVNSLALDFTAAPTYSDQTVRAATCGSVYMQLMTFTGSATGTRYVADGNGAIATTGGATYFPGSGAGTTSNGGEYF